MGHGSGGAGGLEGGTAQVVGGQAQSTLLLGGEGCWWCHGAAAVLASDSRTPPCAVTGCKIGAHPDRQSIDGRIVRNGRLCGHVVLDGGHARMDSRGRVRGPGAWGLGPRP